MIPNLYLIESKAHIPVRSSHKSYLRKSPKVEQQNYFRSIKRRKENLDPFKIIEHDCLFLIMTFLDEKSIRMYELK